jgi:16S rRNA (cytidine1402-2'-O)-methyltransferase
LASSLYLIPVTLGDEDIAKALPPASLKIAQALDTFIVENEKSARRFLSAVKTARPVRELTLLSLNEHTKPEELPALLAPLLEGKDVGLISEAGCPGVADPGAQMVALAHRHHVRVVPLVGPSSILLALMASGFNGQRFVFLGYLPSEKAARVQRLKKIEKASQQNNETQIFIETPYRNQHLLQDILATCRPEAQLCVACDLTLESENILSQSLRQWKANPLPDLHKRPAVFLLLAS